MWESFSDPEELILLIVAKTLELRIQYIERVKNLLHYVIVNSDALLGINGRMLLPFIVLRLEMIDCYFLGHNYLRLSTCNYDDSALLLYFLV